MKIHIFIFIAVAAVLTGCSRGPARISVTNASGIPLSNVQISGEHFANSLGSMTAGMSLNFTLTSHAESNIWVAFEAKGQEYDSRGSNRPHFFEVSSRHPLSLTIGTDLEVKSQ